MTALVIAALAATVAMSLTHGVVMEVAMGVAGLLWIIVIVSSRRSPGKDRS